MSKLVKIGSLVKDVINPRRLYISNCFKSDFKKKVLISYITAPFIKRADFSHSNNAECLEIAKIFHNRGYQVDIIRYNTDFKNIKFENNCYDIVFGLEPNFLKAIEKFKPRKTIYYATGAHYSFQNSAEEQRLLDLEKRKGLLLKPRRFVSPHESASFADAVICFGNEWTKDTYKNRCKKIELIRISAYSFFPFNEIKNEKKWIEAHNNFLWFGSVGAVHKGLDLLLDIFKKHQDLHLYVCGNVSAEKDFFSLYADEFKKYENIHLIGWINPDSKKFKEIVILCAFNILPSCSEGMSGSVATGMHSGLIPMVSKETGINIGESGILFESNNLDAIEEKIVETSKMSTEWIRKKSSESFIYAKNNFTIENFSEDFENALNKIL